MSNVRWSVDGPDEEGLEVEGRRFSTNDEGAPMMCNLVCQALGRHVHIDYCRAKTPADCRANHEVQHVMRTLRPEPDRPKDFLTHTLFWKRSGKSNTAFFILVSHPVGRVQGSVFARRASKLCKVASRFLRLLRARRAHYAYSDSMCAGKLSLLCVLFFEMTFP